MSSGIVSAYKILKGDRIFINETRFSDPVRSIHENAPAGKVRFVFESGDDLTVEIGDQVVAK